MARWERLDIYERDKFHCSYCDFDGSSFDTWPFLVIDHINPHGPRDEPANLATCCHRCNDWKGDTLCANVEQAKGIIAEARAENLRYWKHNVEHRIHR